MIKHQFEYVPMLIVLIAGGIVCLNCPALKPNTNVHIDVVPSNLGTNLFGRNHSGKAAEQPGTTVTYNCYKYFKSAIRGQNGGTLNCTANGKWTNHKAFKKFRCIFDCGKIPGHKSELISHGTTTKPKNWPWVATIFRQTKAGHFKYSCGGTLIGQKTVLTAAHCLTNASMKKLPNNIFQVLLGTSSSSFNENEEVGVQHFSIKEIHVHPDYNSDSFVADIAIIVLTKFAILNEAVYPICLPRSHEHNNLAISIGSFGEIASFGIDGTGHAAKTLQHANIPVVSSVSCHNVINVIPYGGQFCAGNLKGPIICRGDSGSGLVFTSVEWNEEKYSIHGIVSSTGELANGCAPLFIMTKVYSYIIWIEEIFIPVENLEITSTKQTKAKPTFGPSLYSRLERKALAKLLPMVKDILLEDYMHKDEYLIRFLRTKHLNLKETKDMLQSTMVWRKANRMNEILKEDFTDYQHDFPGFAGSFDKDGRPVFVFWAPFWDLRKLVYHREFAKSYRYVLRNFEETEKRIRAVGKRNITQCVLIHDYNGLEISKHFCPICLTQLASLFRLYENHYPRQFYLLYIINIPFIAETIFDTIVPSEYSISGLRLFGTNKTEWSQELLKQIPADQLFAGYGGTKSIKPGTKRRELAL